MPLALMQIIQAAITESSSGESVDAWLGSWAELRARRLVLAA
jgi:hypothetical protein